MNTSAPILHVENISKVYRLGTIGRTTLRDELQRRRARRLHREDPTRRIGSAMPEDENGLFYALQDISFDVRRGESIGVIGHNGAGKSTLLKLITNITLPTEGRICLDGKISSMLEVGTGFHPELTGRENIYLNGAILGMKKEEIEEKIESIIDFSECRQFIDTPVKRYSSGMYIKLAFSVAAHLDSEIILMDEVLAVGDVAFQNKCIQKMKDIASSGRTILYVSHNMTTIRSLCSRCIVLEQGHLIYDGDTDTAIRKYLKESSVQEQVVMLHEKYRLHARSGRASMESLLFVDRDRPDYQMGEKVVFDLNWSCTEAFSDMRLRIGIWSAEQTALSFSLSGPFSGVPGSSNCVRVELDTSALISGSYSLEILLVQANDEGRMTKHDGIRNAASFRVIEDPEMPVFRHVNRDWGHFLVPVSVKENREA